MIFSHSAKYQSTSISHNGTVETRKQGEQDEDYFPLRETNWVSQAIAVGRFEVITDAETYANEINLERGARRWGIRTTLTSMS